MTLLETSTAEGALKGMVTARAPHELNDQECAYLQDAIINQPGFVNRRGAITGTTAITAANLDSQRPIAINTVYDPSGVQKIGIFYFKDTGAALELWVSVYTSSFVFVQKHFILTSPFYPVKWGFVHTAVGIDGSLIISFRYSYSRDPSFGNVTVAIGKWHGACPSTSYAAGAAPTATVATTEGITSVTGAAAEIAKISFPGAILLGFGVVASVTSTTQVELVYPATRTQAATATSYFVVENLAVFRSRGKISCAAGVLSGITGYGTKFTESKDRATAAATSGFTYVDPTTMKTLAMLNTAAPPAAASDTLSGTPTSVLRSASLKNYLLYANEGITDASFNRHRSIFLSSLPTPKAAKGSLFANYKGYMVSFNAAVATVTTEDAGDLATTSRAYVHGPRFPEVMDHSAADGDWFEVPSTKGGDTYGVAVVSGADCVVLCKAQESYALTGNNPDDFSLNKIADDGALSYDGVASWRGKAIWAGRTGIWMYSPEMGEPENILENTISPTWKTLVTPFSTNGGAFDSDNQQINVVHCFVYKDYLFVNVMNTASTHSVYTDGVARIQNPMQLMIYMPTRAVSFITNFNFQGFVQIGNAGYVILPQLGSVTHHLFPVDNLFNQGSATVDTILTANSYNSGSVSTSVGPWFHMESRKFDAGDGLWRKTWKQLSIESLMTNTKRIWLETVAGLNTTGVRQPTPYVGTGLFVAIKNKFNARNQYMSFRLYEDINNRPATLQLGAWQWAYKLARRGQV